MLKRTAEQNRAIQANGHVLVTACPGSGKTGTLSEKAAHILTASPSRRLVAVTFTRDAASELNNRIRALIPDHIDVRGRLIVGTFHSISKRQLRGVKKLHKFRILGAGEHVAIVMRAIQRACAEGEITFDDASSVIDAMKSSMNAPSPAGVGGDVYRAYQEILKRERLLDFADLLLITVQMMEAGELPPIPATDMLVDEFQDADDVQCAWVAAHASNGTTVTVVGDDDQSIYGWRHALGYAGMIRFKDQFQAEEITLTANFRSDKNILHHANQLIIANKQRVDKRLRPTSTQEGVVEVVANEDVASQAQAVAVLVSDGNEWFVLSRTNRNLDMVELALMERRVNYSRVGGSEIWKIPEVAVYLSLLKAIEKNDSSGLGTVLHWGGVPDTAMEPLRHHHEVKDAMNEIYSSLTGAEASSDDSLKLSAKFAKQLGQMHSQWQSLMTKGRVSLVCLGVSEWFGGYLKPRDARIVGRAGEVISRLTGTLPQRLAFLSSAKDTKNNDGATVKLMSMHASKGLEANNVCIISAVEGTSPNLDSPIEEERRVMYVAMTRARHRLVLSHYLVEGSEEKPINVNISRFIKEAGL